MENTIESYPVPCYLEKPDSTLYWLSKKCVRVCIVLFNYSSSDLYFPLFYLVLSPNSFIMRMWKPFINSVSITHIHTHRTCIHMHRMCTHTHIGHAGHAYTCTEVQDVHTHAQDVQDVHTHPKGYTHTQTCTRRAEHTFSRYI